MLNALVVFCAKKDCFSPQQYVVLFHISTYLLPKIYCLCCKKAPFRIDLSCLDEERFKKKLIELI